MVLPLIICLIKPSSPICQDKLEEVDLPLTDEQDDLTQDQLLQLGGAGLLVAILLALLIWALNKAVNLRQRLRRLAHEETATELKEIRRSLRDDGRKLI